MQLDMTNEIKFVHPKDMRDGKVAITANDITTNLPYVPGAHIAFDHHASETLRNQSGLKNQVTDAKAPSAARAVFDYYGVEETIWATNRFMIYALFPQCNISIHVVWGVQKQNTVLATGKSILGRNSKTNAGALMLAYDGGGHPAAGTCQVENDQGAEVLQKSICQINLDG